MLTRCEVKKEHFEFEDIVFDMHILFKITAFLKGEYKLKKTGLVKIKKYWHFLYTD